MNEITLKKITILLFFMLTLSYCLFVFAGCNEEIPKEYGVRIFVIRYKLQDGELTEPERCHIFEPEENFYRYEAYPQNYGRFEYVFSVVYFELQDCPSMFLGSSPSKEFFFKTTLYYYYSGDNGGKVETEHTTKDYSHYELEIEMEPNDLWIERSVKMSIYI